MRKLADGTVELTPEDVAGPARLAQAAEAVAGEAGGHGAATAAAIAVAGASETEAGTGTEAAAVVANGKEAGTGGRKGIDT